MNTKEEKLNYILKTVTSFVKKESGGFISHDDQRLQVASIPEQLARQILDKTNNVGSWYFMGWGEEGEKNISVHLYDLQWDLEESF